MPDSAAPPQRMASLPSKPSNEIWVSTDVMQEIFAVDVPDNHRLPHYRVEQGPTREAKIIAVRMVTSYMLALVYDRSVDDPQFVSVRPA